MEDLHSFHTRNYDKSADLERVSSLQQFFIILKVLPRFIVKVLFVLVAEIYYSYLAPIYHYFVPEELANIHGQLAAVSEKCIESLLLLFRRTFRYFQSMKSLERVYLLSIYRFCKHFTGKYNGFAQYEFIYLFIGTPHEF